MPTFKGNPIITNFDMSKLEVEYDYDTDCEQLKHSKKMMFHELIQAIEFFIKEDPIKLVDNVLLWGSVELPEEEKLVLLWELKPLKEDN